MRIALSYKTEVAAIAEGFIFIGLFAHWVRGIATYIIFLLNIF